MKFAVLLQTYAVMNLLLVLSYGIYFLLRKTDRLRPLSHRSWISLAQLCIGLSILLPIGMQTIPRDRLTPVEWSEFQALNDSGGVTPLEKGSVETLRLQTQGPVEIASTTIIEARDWARGLNREVLAFVFLIVLATGFSFMLGRLGWNLVSLCRLLYRASLIHRVGSVRIVVSDDAKIPFSTKLGWVNWVALPAAMVEKPKDFRLALKHELQHHRQRDTAWAVGIEFLLCFFFLNLPLWRWKKKITELQEFSCDEALLGRRGISSHDYGSCLVRVAEAALGIRKMHVGTTCMTADSKNPSHFKSLLRRRIEMFMMEKKSRPNRFQAAVVGTLALTFTVVFAYGAEKVARSGDGATVNPGEVIVDADIQAIAEKALKHAIASENAKAGFAVVADPTTGKILAVANIDPKRKGFWSLSQTLEPASFMKTVVAAQAIESGFTTPEASHGCENGSYHYQGKTYHDWKKGGWASLTTTETLGNSSDICAIKIAEKVGAEGLLTMMKNFGFGKEGSAKSFPQAKQGSLPQDSKLIVAGISSGFSFKASPIELIQAYGAIANGGMLLKPQVANATGGAEEVRRVLSVETAAKTREMLHQVVKSGTAKGRAESSVYSMAGKTATSYIPDLTKWDLVQGYKRGNFAGFIGFAPANNPRVEVYVGIEDPKTDKTGAHGGQHAAPVFKQIAEDVLKHWNVPSDKT